MSGKVLEGSKVKLMMLSTEMRTLQVSSLFYEMYTKSQAKREIFEYIEFHYNRVRSHSYLGNLSPSKFEEINLVLQLDTAA